MQTGNIQVINPTVNANDPEYAFTTPESISNDGRLITVRTKVVNQFIPGTRSASGTFDGLLFDRAKNTWTLLNQPTNGIMQNAITVPNGASCDGSIILLNSYATNLVSGYSGSNEHVFLVDVRNGHTITDITSGATGYSWAVDISCNGRYVIYQTQDRVHITPTPAGIGTSTHIVRYDRLTGEYQYVSSKSDGSFSSQGASGLSVTDKGDVLESIHTYSSGGFAQFTINLKHLSDGSGTLEPVQHNTNGLQFGNGAYAITSGDGRYVIATSKDSIALGIPGSLNGSGNPIYNVIRIKTGL